VSGAPQPAPPGLGIPLDPATPRVLLPLARALQAVNRVAMAFGMVALLAASVVLTYSVVSRYFMKASTDWQDEAAVFCLVGMTFMCGAFVQSIRGHIGIEAVGAQLSTAANRVRMVAIDLVSLGFCAFFAWKSWTLLHEAWVDGMTSSSSWAPPLWIPYGLMSLGMSLLTLQLLVQVCASINRVVNRAEAL
jgi:TRAP-type C4-dicarboxylate transport system permease small subunit